MNMQNPVDMPSGGIRILRAVTTVRPSCTRQTRDSAGSEERCEQGEFFGGKHRFYYMPQRGGGG